MRTIDLRNIETTFPQISRKHISTLQVNLGYLCNQSCVHCHVNASPHRKEQMNEKTALQLIQLMETMSLEYVDLTGGAPELNSNFQSLVVAARNNNIKVIDRCNLTVLFEPGMEQLPGFLAEQEVNIVASLPCYLKDNVEKQRGKGVFEKSIEALRWLNDLGYGISENLELNLVFNPQGPSLPPSQAELELEYKDELQKRYGIVFNNLYTMTNMPINRFAAILLAQGQFHEYMSLLRNNHKEKNLDTVMCRTGINVDFEGYLYDCDFNQMLGLPTNLAGKRTHITDLLHSNALHSNSIEVANHCFGCTAGQGSSCRGTLS